MKITWESLWLWIESISIHKITQAWHVKFKQKMFIQNPVFKIHQFWQPCICNKLKTVQHHFKYRVWTCHDSWHVVYIFALFITHLPDPKSGSGIIWPLFAEIRFRPDLDLKQRSAGSESQQAMARSGFCIRLYFWPIELYFWPSFSRRSSRWVTVLYLYESVS